MASVIKAGRVISSGTSVQHSEFNFEDMSQNAAQYLETIRERAARLVQQAQQQAQEVLAQAEQQGRDAAVQEARKVALAELDARWRTLEPALRQAVAATEQLRASWMKRWEENVIQLVIAIAERVIRRELSRRPEISQQWIREALELATGKTSITLLLNPDDYQAFASQRKALEQQFHQLADAKVVADPHISAGGCRVLTEHGRIDQQLETQLARIDEELTT